MKNKNKNNDNMNIYADLMLNRIMDCVKVMMEDVPRIKSAFVDSINDDNTVNIKLPGNDKVYTRIQNQSIYQDLVPGDMVKLLLEDGSFSNCWIIARYPRTGVLEQEENEPQIVQIINNIIQESDSGKNI